MHNDLDVAHLDIKLENLVLGEDGTVKLIDFGHSESASIPVSSSSGKGTKSYQAPEQANFKGPYDAKKADIFALGVLLFCLSF